MIDGSTSRLEGVCDYEGLANRSTVWLIPETRLNAAFGFQSP